MSALTTHPIKANEPIDSVESLRNHLAQAAAVELSTIPLYLYAAYSIKTSGYSQWYAGMSAFRAIRSVVIEEMLHLCLARNLLVAVGGGEHLRFYDKEFVPTYPSPMLHHTPDLQLSLEPCSVSLMQDVFMPLELPAKVHAPPEADEYHTLGQFYAAITLGFEKLAGPDLWKHNRADLQYQDTYWNNDGGGSPVQVTDLPSALEAIETIVEQGEGSDPDNAEVPISFDDPQPGLVELSHYAKFSAIAAGVDEIGDVWPVVENPRAHQFEQPVRALAELFNAAYCYVLCMIDSMYETPRVLDGPTSKRYGLERSFVSAMGGLLYPLGDLLVRQPLGDGKHAAPTFEFYEFDPARDKKEQLTALCHDAARTYPQLGGDDGVQRLIGLLPAV